MGALRIQLLAFKPEGSGTAVEFECGDRSVSFLQSDEDGALMYYVARGPGFRSAGIVESPVGLVELSDFLDRGVWVPDGLIEGGRD